MNGRAEAEYAYPVRPAPSGVHAEAFVSPAVAFQWGTLACAGILLILPFETFAEYFPNAAVLMTAGILFFLANHSFRNARKRGENPWLEPISLLTCFYFVKYGLGALVIYYWSQYPWEAFPNLQNIFLSFDVQDNIPATCHLFLLGGVGLSLGASCSGRRISEWLPSLRWPLDASKFHHNLILYAPVALVIFVILPQYLPVSIRFAIVLFGYMVWVMMVIVSYLWLRADSSGRLKWAFLLVIMYASLFATFLATGMREQAFKPLLMLGLGYILARGKLPWRGIIPALFVLVFLISPWMSLYKFAKSTGGPNMSALERFGEINAEFGKLTTRGRIELTLYGIVGRIAGAGAGFVPVYAAYYPDYYPFEMGQTFALEIESLVPRILWTDKPNLSAELNRYTAAVGMLREYDEYDETVTSATFDAISEYFINFGAYGVFVLCVLHGYYLRVLYEWLVRRSNLEIGASIYLVLFFINHDFQGVVSQFVSQTRQIPIWLFVLFIMSRKVKS